MQKIPLKYAKEGMILANPAKRSDGLVLVGEGTELTNSILNRLHLAGIPTITVEGNPVPGVDNGDYNSLLDALDPMFRNWQESRFMTALQAVIKSYFYSRLAYMEDKAEEAAETETSRQEG